MIDRENDNLNNSTLNYDDNYVNFTSTISDMTSSIVGVTSSLGMTSHVTSFVPVDKMNTTDSGILAMPLKNTCLVVFFVTLIVITILGNTLIIMSVITTRRLRTVTNCFVMSLAIADWMVGMFVTPPAVLRYIYGK